MLDKVEEGIINVYADHLADGVDIETIKEMVAKETWMTGDEAARYFNVEVGPPLEVVACSGEMLDKFRNAPQQLKDTKKKSLAVYQARLNLLKLKGGTIDE